jgi:hypothetical protein
MEKDQNGIGISQEGVAYTLDSTGAQAIAQTGEVMPPEAHRESICSAEASRSCARTSPSPASERDSAEASAPACSSSSPGSPMTLFGPEDGSSLRTFPDFFPATVAEISPSYSRRWPSSGFTTSPGECWTADTSECPSGGDACSSLADVLLERVPSRFFLSPRAAAGILRRAEKRGRELPAALQTALSALAQSAPSAEASSVEDGDSGPTREQPVSLSPPSRLNGARGREDLPGMSVRTSSPIPSEPKASTPARTEPDEERRSSVRRLTPTECERLQNFPDGWTIPHRTARATPPSETPSPSQSRNGSAGESTEPMEGE